MKQFILIVSGAEDVVNTALKMLMDANVEIRSMASYGGSFFSGQIVTYFVCYGDCEHIKKAKSTAVSEYSSKYGLPELELKYKEGKINKNKYDSELFNLHILKYAKVLE